jgi:hypothetical protein
MDCPAEGANTLQGKRRMGHEDIRPTFNVYGHLFDDDEDSLVERLDRRARGAARRCDVVICWQWKKRRSLSCPPNNGKAL